MSQATYKMKIEQLVFDIKLYIKNNSISQKQFAELTKLSSSTLSRLLLGNTHLVEFDHLANISKVLRKPVLSYIDTDLFESTVAHGKSTDEQITSVIYSDSTLDDVAKSSLANLMSVAYKTLVLNYE